MKARLPEGFGGGAGNMNQLVKQAQKMQEDMQRIQGELAEKEYSVTAGGGMVELTMNGKHQVTKVKLQPDAVSPDDVEMLEDLLAAAVNEAVRVVDADSDEQLGKVSGGLGLPGLG